MTKLAKSIGIGTAALGVAAATFVITEQLGNKLPPSPPLQILAPFTPISNPVQPYSIIVHATGGVQPYFWSIPNNHSISQWLALHQIGNDAILTGANNFTGRLNFTIRVQDSSKKIAQLNIWFVKGA